MKRKTLLYTITLILLQCLLTATLIAQTIAPPKQWDKRFGGGKNDDLLSLRQTADGGYIFGGFSFSKNDGDKTQTNWDPSRYTPDYWVVKTDADGKKQWDKTFGGTTSDFLSCLEQTNDGGYILGGYSLSGISGDKTETSRGQADYWIIKIDANGLKLWDKTFGGSSDDYCQTLQQTMDGGYILGGYSYSGKGYDKTQSNWDILEPTPDYWIVKIDANGTKQWDKTFGGTETDVLNSLQQTTDGGYILGGSSESDINGDKTEESRGGDDYWILKIDSNGIKKWDKRFGGIGSDNLTSIQQTTDGGYILGGYSSSGIGGDKTQANWDPANYLTDYWVVKTDASGIKQWDKRFGGTQQDYLLSLQQTADGEYILGGYSKSLISGDKTQDGRGNSDFWVVKLGCPPGARIGSNNGHDICTTGSVRLITDGSTGVKYQWVKDGVKIVGATDHSYTATTPGYYRAIVYANMECSQLSEAFRVINSCKTDNVLTVSPNPSSGPVTVNYTRNTTTKIQLNVLDKTGKPLFTKTVQAIAGNNTYPLNLTHLAAGIYNLQLVNGNEKKDVRFVIEQ